MHWRIRWLLYWLVAAAAYVAGWQSYEGLRRAGLDQAIALVLGVSIGLGALGSVAVIRHKWRQARAGRPEPCRAPRDGDARMLNERQQRLMDALQHAIQSERDVVVLTGDGEKGEYMVEKSASDSERFQNP
jgi:hypothetical protein